MEELSSAIDQMDYASAPGPDGFTGKFNSFCWEIIKTNMLNVVLSFFAGNEIPKAWSSTLLTLIPKVPSPSSFSQMRPISLCNFNFKIISRLINNRLAPLLPSLISQEQSGFVKDRNIHDNILLAYELTQYLD
jgi:hypothetical protein